MQMKNNGLTGQGRTQPKTSLIDNSVSTMSSLKMVAYINDERKSKAEAEGLSFPCKEYRVLQHKDFLKKTPKVLGGSTQRNFSLSTKTAQGDICRAISSLSVKPA